MEKEESKIISIDEIKNIIESGENITLIPKGELLSFGFCTFGYEDENNRWAAEENILVIPLGDKVPGRLKF